MSRKPKREGSPDAVLLDDDVTVSGSDSEPLPARTPAVKSKVEVEVDEKVHWTDDSGGEYERLKKRKRKPAGFSKQSKKRGRTTKGRNLGEPTAPEADDPFEAADVPDYLRERKKTFDQRREALREAGLLLPPDFSDVHFPEDDHLGDLAELPKFDESSGIKPWRPYLDVELEYSAGIIPASIAQYLRDYQIVGVRFLHRLFVYQKGGILGDDMGLGKTVQVAAFLTAAFGKTGDERDKNRMRTVRNLFDRRWYPRVLIICPGSLIQNWQNELRRWGWWEIEVFHGAGKDDALDTARAGRTEILITTYATYKNYKSRVNMVAWDAVIADECHIIKDRSSETTKAMSELNALCRIGLTGTAIQNNYEELWTLLNWTNPGYFGTMAEWKNTISEPLKAGQSHDATFAQLSLARKTARKLVQNLLPGFFLRRMKTLIAHQLPRKTDRVVFCPLTEVQKEAYQNFLDSEAVTILRTLSEDCECGSDKKKGWCCSATLEDGRHWREVVFPSVITLQKIANHVTLLVPSSNDLIEKQRAELVKLQTCLPDDWQRLYQQRESMLNLANPEFCGKWKVLKRLLRFWHANGDKVLVFSHSVRLLRILQYLFHNTSYDLSYLDGSLSYEERQAVVDTFNSDANKFVFLISTKAGGVGLNITSANKVVVVDPHWNPSYDLQAQDRAYRIGQTRDVDVFRLISAGTIDEIVYARQIYKQQQANIGYSASSERRYFKGVQHDQSRRGEIFGLENLFSFHDNHIVLRDIVNKTNIAEAKVGVNLVTVDLEQTAKEEEDDALSRLVKQAEGAGAADADDAPAGMQQLTRLLTAENQRDFLLDASKPAKSDAIQAILASAGVEYTHENSEVVGTSTVEAQLSRRAEMAALEDATLEGDTSLFADVDLSGEGDDGFACVYNPPPEVMQRQFCSMAQEFGFATVTDFALTVEGMTQEERRNCLNAFYRRREARAKSEDEEEEGDVKSEMVDANDEAYNQVVTRRRAIKVEDQHDGETDYREARGSGADAIVGGARDGEAGQGGDLGKTGPTAKSRGPFPSRKIGEEAVAVQSVQSTVHPIFVYDDDDDDEL